MKVANTFAFCDGWQLTGFTAVGELITYAESSPKKGPEFVPGPSLYIRMYHFARDARARTHTHTHAIKPDM